MTHKQWLDNEYSEWVKALQESTVYNFKEHPMVKKMLGEPEGGLWFENTCSLLIKWVIIEKIDKIGFETQGSAINANGRLRRMVYYANEIMKRNPSSICEIGGGVGEFYAILRALGWEGHYCIYDLSDVRIFQKKYLEEVEKRTGLKFPQDFTQTVNRMVVSFYALGEFDDDTKKQYEGIIEESGRGYIAWNPHSGAADDLSLFKHDIKVSPGIEPGVKIIQW